MNGHVAVGTGNPDLSLEGSTLVASGEWVHVAATRRATDGQLQLIVNGELEASVVTGKTGPLDDPPMMALGGASLIRNFIGSLDEMRIWDIVRTPLQVRETMRVVSGANEPGLVGYYRFEDPGGATTADTSSSNADAVLVGEPGFEASTALCAP